MTEDEIKGYRASLDFLKRSLYKYDQWTSFKKYLKHSGKEPQYFFQIIPSKYQGLDEQEMDIRKVLLKQTMFQQPMHSLHRICHELLNEIEKLKEKND